MTPEMNAIPDELLVEQGTFFETTALDREEDGGVSCYSQSTSLDSQGARLFQVAQESPWISIQFYYFVALISSRFLYKTIVMREDSFIVLAYTIAVFQWMVLVAH